MLLSRGEIVNNSRNNSGYIVRIKHAIFCHFPSSKKHRFNYNLVSWDVGLTPCNLKQTCSEQSCQLTQVNNKIVSSLTSQMFLSRFLPFFYSPVLTFFIHVTLCFYAGILFSFQPIFPHICSFSYVVSYNSKWCLSSVQ